MIVLLIVSFIALILTYYASRGDIPFGLEMAFVLVGFVAAIHYNYGNDYKDYVALYNNFSQYEEFDWDYLMLKKIYKEPGWLLLNFLFKPFGFFTLVAFLSVVQNFIYYLLVKTYIPKEWWILGVFIYLFNTSLYVINMSMMRQGLTVSLFVLAWIIWDKTKKIFSPISFVLILIASSIHNSAIVVYPCLLIKFLNRKTAPFYALGVIILFILFFAIPDLVNSLFLQFSDIEDIQRLLLKYEDSSTKLSYGIGFAMMMIPFAAMFFFLTKNENTSTEDLKILALAILAYSIMPFRQSIPMMGRMGYYFTAFSIPAIPIVCKKISYPYVIYFLASYIFLIFVEYWKFFTSETYSKWYMQFHSIFEVIF